MSNFLNLNFDDLVKGFIVEQVSTTEEAKPAKNKPKKASKE